MKKTGKNIYFEDTDTPDDIKKYFKSLCTAEEKFYKIFNNDKIDEVLKELEKLNFIAVTTEQKNNMVEMLEKEKSSALLNEKYLYDKKCMAFISLIDYIKRNEEDFPHEFSFVEKDYFYSPNFSGIFQNEILRSQFVGINLIMAFPVSMEDSPNLPPSIDIKKNFNSLINDINISFVINKNQFKDLIIEYQKEDLERKLSVKITNTKYHKI